MQMMIPKLAKTVPAAALHATTHGVMAGKRAYPSSHLLRLKLIFWGIGTALMKI